MHVYKPLYPVSVSVTAAHMLTPPPPQVPSFTTPRCTAQKNNTSLRAIPVVKGRVPPLNRPIIPHRPSKVSQKQPPQLLRPLRLHEMIRRLRKQVNHPRKRLIVRDRNEDVVFTIRDLQLYIKKCQLIERKASE